MNIHPGSAVKGYDKEKCLQQIGESINRAHLATSNVTVLLENMCKQVGHYAVQFHPTSCTVLPHNFQAWVRAPGDSNVGGFQRTSIIHASSINSKREEAFPQNSKIVRKSVRFVTLATLSLSDL